VFIYGEKYPRVWISLGISLRSCCWGGEIRGMWELNSKKRFIVGKGYDLEWWSGEG
jgi:hypothetical protein